MQMADVRKTVTKGEGSEPEVTEQAWSDTNAEVVRLFGNKPDLEQITFVFNPESDVKLKVYQRL